MISRILTLVGIAIIMLIGVVRLRLRRTTIEHSRRLLDDFVGHYQTYLDSRGQDIEAYNWLITHSVEMQRELGRIGVIDAFKPAGANFIIRNVQVLTNTLPDLHRNLNDSLLSHIRHLAESDAQAIIEVLLRHHGQIESRMKQVERDLSNPLTLFRVGVEAIVRMPIAFLRWFRLLTDDTASSIAESVIVRMIAAIFGLVSIISAVIGLVVDWGEFLTIVKDVFRS